MQALSQRGHDILVLSDQRPNDLPPEEVLGNVRVLRFPFRPAIACDAALHSRIRRTIGNLKRDFRPQLSYIFSSGYAELFHHHTNDVETVPLVTTLHDMFEAERFRPDHVV